jgi:sugar phosphate isomerase/epimerase
VRSKVNILGSYWTLAAGTAPLGLEVCAHDIGERVECAARAGYAGMGFWHADLAHLKETIGFGELNTILQANGIVDIEVEWLNDWYGAGEVRAASDRTRALLLEAAEAIGARHIKVSDLANVDVPLERMIEEFAVLCAQAADRGTNVLFEMLPADFPVSSLDLVLALTKGAGAANGGIMLDNLHILRTATPFSDIVAKLAHGPDRRGDQRRRARAPGRFHGSRSSTGGCSRATANSTSPGSCGRCGMPAMTARSAWR